MSIDPKMAEVMEQHGFASMLGSISVVTFSEGEHRESFAFVDGLPIPYNRFGAVMTACLFRHDSDIGREWKVSVHEMPKIDPLASLWTKIKLSPAAREEHDPFRASPMAEKRVRALIQSHCTSTVEEIRREQLIQLIEQIENELIESLANPVAVTGLSRIYDFPASNAPLMQVIARFEAKTKILKAKLEMNLKFGRLNCVQSKPYDDGY